MVTLKIDDKEVSIKEGSTILEAAKSAGIPIPTLCFLKDINEIGACRVCVVEIEGINRLVASCNNVAEEGMVIYTNSPKVREARRINVELLLSQHDAKCAACVRSNNCSLQKLSNDLGVYELHYEENLYSAAWDHDFPLIRNHEKCIKCMRCIQVCDKIQDLNVWDISHTGSRTNVDVSYNRKIEDADCSLCGQCIINCPVGALRERSDTDKVFDCLADEKKITIVQIAPAVRTSWGESLDLDREFLTVNRLVAALRKMGFDYIFDTNFSADLTIMEEGSEFLERIKDRENSLLPMFTSCCPAWIRFMKTQFPEMLGHLSSAKSPQQMFGAVAKTYYAEILGVSPEDLTVISIMPCLAKKYECDVEEVNDSLAEKDVDFVLTTREIERMIRAEHISVQDLEEEEFDAPLGISSGAGVIFGATGGVMEAALRSAYFLVNQENPDPDAFQEVRGKKAWKEASFKLGNEEIKVAVASGLKNARDLTEAVKRGECSYDFIEVMACPGGCVNGGGQPIGDSFGEDSISKRSQVLYGLDKKNKIRFSHENPAVLKCYEDFLDKPASEIAHNLLHTDHKDWKI